MQEKKSVDKSCASALGGQGTSAAKSASFAPTTAMTQDQEISQKLPADSCLQCGGSGMLRLSDQRYRTCLECLGQGKASRLSGVITTADLLQGQLPAQPAPQSLRKLSAVEFSSGAK